MNCLLQAIVHDLKCAHLSHFKRNGKSCVDCSPKSRNGEREYPSELEIHKFASATNVPMVTTHDLVLTSSNFMHYQAQRQRTLDSD